MVNHKPSSNCHSTWRPLGNFRGRSCFALNRNNNKLPPAAPEKFLTSKVDNKNNLRYLPISSPKLEFGLGIRRPRVAGLVGDLHLLCLPGLAQMIKHPLAANFHGAAVPKLKEKG